MYKIKRDKYKSARGGYSRLLDLTCAYCSSHISFYQKDGAGILKRLYLDRMIDLKTTTKELRCPSCEKLVGIYMVYEKEQREAFRLFVGAVSKKVVSTPQIGKL